MKRRGVKVVGLDISYRACENAMQRGIIIKVHGINYGLDLQACVMQRKDIEHS